MSRARVVELGLVLLCGCRGRFDEHAPADVASDHDVAPVACTTSAQPVPPSGAISGTLVAGTGDTAGSCGGDGVAELVYAIDVPPGSGIIAAADGPTTQGNDLVYVRTDCADPASEVACDRDSGIGDQGQLRINSLAAGRYYVLVDGQDGAVGTFDGEVVLLQPQGATCTGNNTRDRCAAELTCTGTTCQPAGCTAVETFTTTGTFARTATTTGDSLHAGTCGQGSDGGARAPEVVYRVALTTGVSNLHVSTDSAMTTYDTLIYVRAGCTGAEVGCDDDSGVHMLTSVVDTGPLPAGEYFVFIDGFSVRSGTASITITISP
jgi:hypothetical protein